jgi:hypothetical protein
MENWHATCNHRYLMSRLSVQVFYLWLHVLSTAPPFILWWSILEILFAPLHRSFPFIGGLRCQEIQTEHGPFIAERTQKAVYIVRCLCLQYTITIFSLKSWTMIAITVGKMCAPNMYSTVLAHSWWRSDALIVISVVHRLHFLSIHCV